MINSIGSKIEYITKLDLSDNDLGDEGVQLVAQGLCNSPSVSHLILNGNFKPPKTRAVRVAAIDALIALLRSPCPLRKLELAAIGNPACTGTRSRAQMQLRQDLLPLLAVISLNTTLTSLDVTGHQMGNKGATALGKALQINHTLLNLAWDENATTLPGFSYFKIGVATNHTLVHMPLPLADINQAMKEASSTNEKLLQIIREIELCIFRNASAGFPPPPSPTPTPHHLDPTPAHTANDLTEASDYTDGSSEGGDLEQEGLDDPNWAWTISGEGVNSPVYVAPSTDT